MSSTGTPRSVEQWDVFETQFTGPAEGNPFVDVNFSARFSSGGDSHTVKGFYDGSGTYRLRFAPPKQGEWKYHTTSNHPALNGETGSFQATSPTRSNHGPVRVFRTTHFAYADGTPYFQVGTTCYAWTHQPGDLQEQTLKTLAGSPFNKLRMCVFPKSFVYNSNEPTRFAFVPGENGAFDFTRFDPVFWQHLERRITDLGELGIEADLILWHPYDRWGFSEMDKAADDRYLRYAIARLSAHRNVWWSLANEYDLMSPQETRRDPMRGNKEMDDWDRFFSILEKEDPYLHLRGIHNIRRFYDHSKPWVTQASVQRNGDLRPVLDWRSRYRKPIIVDECGYEGTIPQGWGKLTGQEMVRRFWIATLSGGYVGHGETYRDPDEILWWSKGGVLHGESPTRIAFLRKTMEALPYTEMVPSRPNPNLLVLSKPDTVYLAYALDPGPITLTLGRKRDYAVDAIDTWNRTTERLKPAKPGEFTLTVPRPDYLLRITAEK
jgi:hypothetical protein